MRFAALIIILAALSRSIAAEAEDAQMELLRQMRIEIAARKLVREHESGTKKAPEDQLAAARAIIRQSQEKKAREAAPGADGSFAVVMKDADITTVAKKWQEIFGGIVVVAERAKAKRVSISASDRSLDVFRSKMESALSQSGIYLVSFPDRLILDSEPDPHRPK